MALCVKNDLRYDSRKASFEIDKKVLFKRYYFKNSVIQFVEFVWESGSDFVVTFLSDSSS